MALSNYGAESSASNAPEVTIETRDELNWQADQFRRLGEGIKSSDLRAEAMSLADQITREQMLMNAMYERGKGDETQRVRERLTELVKKAERFLEGDHPVYKIHFDDDRRLG